VQRTAPGGRVGPGLAARHWHPKGQSQKPTRGETRLSTGLATKITPPQPQHGVQFLFYSTVTVRLAWQGGWW
jgi:hypothetical protein